jgi:hypothetical protein
MCPCLLTDLNATHTGGVQGPFRSSYRVFSFGRALEGEIHPKNPLSFKSKVPLLIVRFERHSHKKFPRPPAFQLSCLSSAHALEGELQPKNELSYMSKVPLLIDRFERHSHRRCPRPSALQLL